MLEARIIAPRGSLYFAAEATPYDLETLRQHVRQSIPHRDAGEVTLELSIDGSSEGPVVATWLKAIAAVGVQVRLLPIKAP